MNLGHIERIHAYSPLRYPGGKTRLLSFFRTMIRANRLRDVIYVEPYAGGAGAALALVISGQVDHAVVNDLDPAIGAFWDAVVNHSDEFAEKVKRVSVTIGEWHYQRDVYRAGATSDPVALGFATFFLNRTNRSGVLDAGPIGGLNQTGFDKIDARFNRESLLERIRLIGLYKKRITVLNEDGVDVVRKYIHCDRALIYADPPYYAKGSTLYLNAFNDDDHHVLANSLNQNASGRWVLTYDDEPAIDALYAERRRIRYTLNYSSHNPRLATELMIFSDSLIAPDSDNVWAHRPLVAAT